MAGNLQRVVRDLMKTHIYYNHINANGLDFCLLFIKAPLCIAIYSKSIAISYTIKSVVFKAISQSEQHEHKPVWCLYTATHPTTTRLGLCCTLQNYLSSSVMISIIIIAGKANHPQESSSTSSSSIMVTLIDFVIVVTSWPGLCCWWNHAS